MSEQITSIVDEVTEAIHRALPSPRNDKWVSLKNYSKDYQSGMRAQAEAAITAVRKWDKENANV